MPFDSVVDTIGHTPLVRLRGVGGEGVVVYAKLELQNLMGMKDRVARSIILEARRIGTLRPGAPIVESSSGTMALGVALVGRALGHDVHIVTDPRIDDLTFTKLEALGCVVHVVESMPASGGWQAARITELHRLQETLTGSFWPRQYSNPDNPRGYALLADELMADLDRLDVLVGSVGSGGSLTGSARALRAYVPDLRVVGVDCAGSALFDQPDDPRRLQSGLGNSLLPANLDRRAIDEVQWLNDREAFAAARDLAAREQIFAGNTSGSVYRALQDVAARRSPGDVVVGIFPDRGDRYFRTVYSDPYWAEKELERLPLAVGAEPVEYGAVVRSWSRADARGIALDPPRLLFVESNTTGTGMQALATARDAALSPVLITREAERYPDLDDGVEVLACDTGSLVELRELLAARYRREEIAGVTTTSEFYVPVVAELTRWLGLPGPDVDAVGVCRNKDVLRARLGEAGLPQPAWAAVTAPAQLPAALAAVGLPCVVKPSDGSGSDGVALCATSGEATAQVGRLLARARNARGLPTSGVAVVEEYVDGPEYSVELFVGADGSQFAEVTQKTVTAPPFFVERRHVFPAPCPPGVRAELVTVARRAAAAAGLGTGVYHLEARRGAHGTVVIELNPRLAGGMIPELVRLASGVDLVEQQVRTAAGLTPALTPTRSACAGIEFVWAREQGAFEAIDGVERAREVPGVRAVAVTGRPGARVRPARDFSDRLGYVIAVGADAAEVGDALDRAVARLEVRVDRTDDTDDTADEQRPLLTTRTGR